MVLNQAPNMEDKKNPSKSARKSNNG